LLSSNKTISKYATELDVMVCSNATEVLLITPGYGEKEAPVTLVINLNGLDRRGLSHAARHKDRNSWCFEDSHECREGFGV